jgi:GABA(A) receptor-associated protein|tara:strand:+ start:205 stop:585 length:381 start_codon:yes stop_codon:yes gene_type:complete
MYSKDNMDFKKEFSLEQRTKEAQRVLTKYPDRIPIICEKVKKSKLDPMTKKKYLVPWDLTIGQFVFILRRRMTLPAEKGIFLFVGNTIPPTSSTVKEIYTQYHSKDGFLYIQYSDENVFGGNMDPI